jgi:hypothetical protein
MGCHPESTFFVTPRRQKRGHPVGRLPERIEGCLAIERYDNSGTFFEKPLFDLERAGREVKLKEVKRGLRRLN